MYRTTGVAGRWVIPDWARVAADFDAVHLTLAGYLTAAGRAVAVSDGTASVLAGWNPDKTYWLGGPAPATHDAQPWRRRDDDGWRED